MLDWDSAKTQEHRAHLSVFRCASPESADWDEETEEFLHDYPWEIEVQDHINRLRVPAHVPEYLLVGYDGAKLVAVLELRVHPLERFCFISAVAVAHTHSGNGLAGEAIDLVHRVMSKYGIESDYVVQARVDPDNHAAQSVFAGRGYENLGMAHGYQTWSRLFLN